ncbi:MAG: hypothetical protein M1608_14015 [Candidatus Omnitrophica bacterium]|nr:hypothetical protein [Candidatus Omnitrophota bacterium]
MSAGRLLQFARFLALSGGFTVLMNAGAIPLPSPQTGPQPTFGTNRTNSAVVRFVSPIDHSIISTNRVQIIVIANSLESAPAITLDGQPIQSERVELGKSWLLRLGKGASPSSATASPRSVAPNGAASGKPEKVLLLANVPLSPGRHTIEAAGSRILLFRSTATDHSDAPAGWPLFQSHPITTDPSQPSSCENCHLTHGSGKDLVLDRVKMPEACYSCHDLVDLRLAHSHVMDPLAECAICHNPHGSTQPNLLINTRAKLCVQCHEAGHSAN